MKTLRAQTEVLGMLLITAVVVALVTLVGATVVLPLATGTSSPVADLQISATPGQLNVSHLGGDALREEALVVVVRGPGGVSRYSFEDGTATGEGVFDAGNSVSFPVALNTGDRPTIVVVHEPSNTVIFEGRRVVRIPLRLRGRALIWSSGEDWDRGRSSHVVHADFGDRLATELRIGASPSPGRDPGLVSYYPLDEDRGVDVVDATGFNHGVLGDTSPAGYDAYDQGVAGIYGSSSYRLRPQGDGAYVDIGTRTSSEIANSAFTWTAWIRMPSGAGDKDTILAANNADRSNNLLWFVCDDADCSNPRGSLTGPGRLVLYDGSFKHVPGSARLNDGAWHHVAMTIDGSGMVRMYVNGTSVGTISTGNRIQHDDIMSIGQDYDDDDYGFESGTSDFFNGTLDEVRIYERALAPSEVSNLSSGEGRFVSPGKRLAEPTSGDGLSITRADFALNGGEITLYVEADPDNDGVYENRSAPIDLQSGRSSYDVSFPGSVTAGTYRLEINFRSGRTSPYDPRISPTFRSIRLRPG